MIPITITITMKFKNAFAWILAGVICLIILANIVPNSRRHRGTSSTNRCINTLRQLDGAKQQWALEHQKKPADVPTWSDICPYIGRDPVNAGCETNLICPEGGSYRLGRLDELPTCSLGRSDSWHRLPK